MIENIHIMCKRNKQEARAVAGDLIKRYGNEKGIRVDDESAAAIGYNRTFELEHVGEGADVIIVLGGDGTLLSVARNLKGKDVPILGVNLGGLGFLTEISLDELPRMMESLLEGDYAVSVRMMLDVGVRRKEEHVFSLSFLNDAVVTKDALARIIDIETYVDEEYLATFRGDGLILSTPTGSTGYSLAAGGPILYPTLEHTVVTPVCPHMLTNRPVILPRDVSFKAVLLSPDERVILTVDGQIGFPLEFMDEVIVRTSPFKVGLIKSASKGYFEILRTKLKWGER